jgi:hypothetical protein
MGVVAVCAVMLLAGLYPAWRWSGRQFVPPPLDAELTATEVARRFTWYAAVVLTAGVLAGLSIAGAGGRLAMRLLAVTSGDAAQGKITEADQVVGRITLDGSLGFILFTGIVGGSLGAMLYLVARRFLPAGRAGAITFGVWLLVVLGMTVDPLRRNNPDFDLVGPGWLAVVTFGALLIAFGFTVVGLAARLSAWLPLFAWNRAVLLRYLAPGAVAAFAFSVTAAFVLVGAVVVLSTRWQVLPAIVRSPRWVVGGRVVGSAIFLVALPNAVMSVGEIVGN